MNCRDTIGILGDYLDGQLTRRNGRYLEQHLKGCPECRAYFASYATTKRLAAAIAGGDDLPADEGLIRTILASSKVRESLRGP
jgi:predicted anti-sigma-YlaC factor YlaD